MTSINYVFTSKVNIEINAPLEYTFPKVFEEDIMKQWLGSSQLEFVGLENISGYKNEVGSQWKLIFSSRKGTRMEMLETITAYEENRNYAFELRDPYFKFHVDMEFENEGGKTLITEKISGKSHNHFFNAMMRIFGGKSRRVKEEQYAKLKEVIEEEYRKETRTISESTQEEQ